MFIPLEIIVQFLKRDHATRQLNTHARNPVHHPIVMKLPQGGNSVGRVLLSPKTNTDLEIVAGLPNTLPEDATISKCITAARATKVLIRNLVR
jgi:hypothetical protein